MWDEVMWVGVPKEEIRRCNILEGDMTGRFAYFRCEVKAEENSSLTLNLAAGSKYRLWVNEQPVLSGPCKGDLVHCYFDTVDVSEYIREGKNVLAVQVLYQDPFSAVKQTDERAAIFGVATPGGGHRLAIEGNVKNAEGQTTAAVTTGKADWKVWLDGSFYLKSYAVTENLGAVCEEIDFQNTPSDWKKAGFEDREWLSAVPLEPVKNTPFWKLFGLVKRFALKERPIPLLYEKEALFEREMKCDKSAVSGILQEPVVIPPHTELEILLDAGAVVNGYPAFRFAGGTGSRVSIVYFEKFMNPEKEIPRDDWKNGVIEGRTDEIAADGKELCYEPFWYRTFRFVRITVKTQDKPLTFRSVSYRRTGYPMELQTQVSSSASWVSEVWNMCVRTLENCMMDTYMDCPYYEEMQFPMDTRLQILFHYAASDDVRLAKKALEDLHSSMTPEGLIQGKYPSAYMQIISTFSLHYIIMLREYYQHTGDLEGIRKYLPDIDRILYYYDQKKGSLDLLEHLGYWEFVDWQPAWAKTGGVPAAAMEGPSTIINLMYAYALLCGAELYEAAGRKEIGSEYRRRQKKITARIQELCWDEVCGMYREGPDFQEYTQHAQAWAVLNHMTDIADSQKILQNAIHGEKVLKVTFSTSYEWFRALEAADLYEETLENMKQWMALPAKGCTTCPETPGLSRSECHAWSALPIYEMVRSMAGVRQAAPGWSKAVIRPQLIGVSDLYGEVMTPRGIVKFAYHKNANGKWAYEISLPKGLDAGFYYPDGRVMELAGGESVCL